MQQTTFTRHSKITFINYASRITNDDAKMLIRELNTI